MGGIVALVKENGSLMRRGRAVARRRGIPVVGTGGLLLGAKRAGRRSSVSPELERPTDIGYRLVPTLVTEIRRLAEA